LTQLEHQADRLAIRIVLRDGVVSELCCPIRVRAPGRRLENRAQAMLAGQFEVSVVVAAQRRDSLVILQQVEGREARQVPSFVEHEGRLESAVGNEQAVAELRQAFAILAHDYSSGTVGQGLRSTVGILAA